MQADSFVLRAGPEEFLAASYFSAAMELRAHLEKFVIADDVTIADETSAWIGAGGWGEEARGVAARVGAPWPRPGEYAWCGPALVFAGRRSARENFEMLLPAGAVPPGWVATATAADLGRERIRSGIPAVPLDLGPGDLPNEGGLEDVAISYTKGCFTGQEVMARLKNLGQVRRRLMVFRGPGEPPAARAPLFQRGRRIGEARSGVRDGEGFLAFGMVSLLSLDAAAGLSLAADAPESLSFVSHG